MLAPLPGMELEPLQWKEESSALDPREVPAEGLDESLANDVPSKVGLAQPRPESRRARLRAGPESCSREAGPSAHPRASLAAVPQFSLPHPEAGALPLVSAEQSALLREKAELAFTTPPCSGGLGRPLPGTTSALRRGLPAWMGAHSPRGASSRAGLGPLGSCLGEAGRPTCPQMLKVGLGTHPACCDFGPHLTDSSQDGTLQTEGPGLVWDPSFLPDVWSVRVASGGAGAGADNVSRWRLRATRHWASPHSLCGQPPWTHSSRLHGKPVLTTTQSGRHKASGAKYPTLTPGPVQTRDRAGGVLCQVLGVRVPSRGRRHVATLCPQTQAPGPDGAWGRALQGEKPGREAAEGRNTPRAAARCHQGLSCS